MPSIFGVGALLLVCSMALGHDRAALAEGVPVPQQGRPAAAAGAEMPGSNPAASEGSVDPRIEALAAKNVLARTGLKPWHVRVSFTVNDASGRKQEDGTVEEWWVAPGRERVVIQSPSFSGTTPGDPSAKPGSLRTEMLVRDLLTQVTDPVQVSRGPFQQDTRAMGAMKLSCLSRAATPGDKRLMLASTPQFCSVEGTDALRVLLSQGRQVLRNRMATFQATFVALDTLIELGGRPVIEGHVDELKTFDPAVAELKFTEPRAEHVVQIPSSVAGGKVISKQPPEYPSSARMGHIQGTVVLCAMIGKDGRIERLEALTSPNEALTGAALAAVRNWKYQPYLLNGEPVAVETTISVNFFLNGG